MQAIPALSPSPSLEYYCDDQFEFSGTVDKVSDDLSAQLQLTPHNDNNTEKSSQIEEDKDEKEGEEEEEDEDEFSFMCTSSEKSAILADDVFQDGQIRPIFPLFNRDLLFSDYDYESSSTEFPPRPPVKVFVEAPPHPSSSSSSETDKNDGVAEGPYCAWSKKATEPSSPDGCKKSNSTGFSKLWRFRDYLDRSNSDGRDAFVFLNNSRVSSKREDKIVEKTESSSKKETAREISSEKKKAAGEVKVGSAGGGKAKVKKGVKGKTASLSAHEVYLRNRGSHDDDRRRSYLPYRPGLVGFFTNVNGGLSRNVHPF